MSDVTILIQGPLDEISISAVQYYKTLGPIVFSYWDINDERLFNEIKDVPHIVRKKNLIPGTKEYTQPTADFQFWGVYYGLQEVSTPYVIRTRSDEWYGNLDPLIKKITDYKIICGNIFFKRWSDIPNHIGDHLFLGRTDWLLKAYEIITHEPQHFKDLKIAEQVLARAIARAKGLLMPPTKDDMKKMVDVININELKPFVAQYRGAKQSYRNSFTEPIAISNIEEW